MDSSAIKELAAQLGIAADKISTDLVPRYAEMSIISNWVPIIALGIISIILIIAYVIVFKMYHKYDDEDSKYHDWEKATNLEMTSWIIGIIAVCFTVMFVVISIANGLNIYNWTNYPDMMFIKAVTS